MVTKWETLFLIVLTLPIMGHVVLLPLLLDLAGRDVWLAVVISVPFAIFIASIIYKIKKQEPDLDFSEIIYKALGKRGGFFIRIVFILYFLFLFILSAAALVDLVFIGFLPDTPRLALLLWLFLFVLYAVGKGMKRIALTASILAFITALTGHTMTLMDAPKKEWSYLLPILEFGWAPVLWGILLLTSVWVELLFLLAIPLENIKEKRLFLVWVIGILLNALMILSTSTGTIAIFGLGQTENLVYPAFSLVRIVNLGFIDRFDVYAIILMTFGVYIRCGLYFRAAYEMSLAADTRPWIKYSTFTGMSLFLFLGSYYLVKDYFAFEQALNLYAFSFLLIPIVVLILFLLNRKNRSQEKQQPHLLPGQAKR